MNKLTKRLRSITTHPLTRDRKAGAIYRYAAYHLRRVLRLSPATYQFVNDLRLIGFHSTAATGNIFTGLHDFEDAGFLLHFLRPADLFADVGANVGTYSLLAAGVCHASTIAIEPVPSALNKLLTNLQLNGLTDRVEVHRCAVGAEAGRVRVTTNRGTMNRVTKQDGDDGEEVSMLTLDQILSGRVPILLKVDVEGYEHEVFRGAGEALNNSALSAVLVELRDGRKNDSVDRALRAAGFRPYRYDPFTRQHTPLETYNRDRFNTLYLRKAEEVMGRVASGPAFTVLGWQV
jgi:FkbM family methyltransferase